MFYLNSIPRAATVLVAGLVSTVLGEARNWNPAGEGCVDPTGFLSCFKTAISDTSSRVLTCSTITQEGTPEWRSCIVATSRRQYIDNISCWIQSCWNQVYSCEYQLTAIDYFVGSDLVQNANVPFYPPPDDASAGACSCNLGYVYGNLTGPIGGVCEIIPETFDDCKCCEISVTSSNILNVCPKSDLSILDFPNRLQADQGFLRSPNNCLILDQNPGSCASEYNVTHYGDKIRNPLNLPAGEPGNDPLSNLPGNAYTETGDNKIFTLGLPPGETRLITFAPFSNGAAVRTQSLDLAGILAGETGGDGGSVEGSRTAAATGQNTAAATGQSTGTVSGQSTGTDIAAAPTPSSGTTNVVMVCVIWAWFSTFFVLLFL